MIALPCSPATFVFLTLFIEPLVAPENQMAYDTLQFYNLALAIVAGLGSAALAFRLAAVVASVASAPTCGAHVAGPTASDEAARCVDGS